MVDYTEKIQEAAKRLLTEGKVDVVIGYRRGTVPMMNEPILVRRADQADQLYWDSFCGVNLANYLPKRNERSPSWPRAATAGISSSTSRKARSNGNNWSSWALPARACWTAGRFGPGWSGQEPLQVREEKDQVLAEGQGFEETFHPDGISSRTIAPSVSIAIPSSTMNWWARLVPEQTGVDRYEDIRAVEAMDPEERWQYFEETDRALHPLLCLSKRLSPVLLPPVLRG